MWDGQIKVITGLRRSGKSVLLFELFKDYLLGQDINEDHILSDDPGLLYEVYEHQFA